MQIARCSAAFGRSDHSENRTVQLASISERRRFGRWPLLNGTAIIPPQLSWLWLSAVQFGGFLRTVAVVVRKRANCWNERFEQFSCNGWPWAL